MFTKIVNLQPNPCNIKDDEGFTPYGIARLPQYNNIKMQNLLFKNCNSHGGKRRKTKRFRNKKKKTQQRRTCVILQ